MRCVNLQGTKQTHNDDNINKNFSYNIYHNASFIRFYPNKHRTITFRISYFNLLYRFDSNELNFALHLLKTKSIVLHPQ